MQCNYHAATDTPDDRLQSEHSLVQQQNESMVDIGVATRMDSRAMKSIALVTVAFLPGTFVAVSNPPNCIVL
jgi:hypothetical protein